MSTITLSCLVVGENPYENAFEVDIEENRSISKLKDAIKEKLHPKFENVTANDIKLWKVDISLEKENEKLIAVDKKINVDIKEELDGEELPPLSKISKHFSSQPADEHIHIIVQRPTEAKEVHVAATYNRKKKTFQWTVTRGMVSLAELKKLLREHFEFPDGTEDEHIVIGRVISGVKRKTSKGKSKKSASKLQSETVEDVTVDVEDAESATGRKVVSFSKDEDLVSIVWTNNRVINLNIAVDTSQQPFSSYSFSKMKALFGLKYDDYDALPEYVLFHESYLDSAVPEDVLDHVIEDILKKHTASRPIRADVNEATRREFISSVIYGVASTFKGTVKIYPEYQVSGTHGKGPIDWIIKIGDIIICVTEAKRNDISWGVGQSTVQAHASMQLNNNKKRTYDDADLDVEEVFCIVSTGTEWVITKVVQKRDNDGNVEVFMCKPMPEPIPINRLSLTRDTLYRPVKHLLSIINNFFMMMKDSVDKRDKRVKLME